MLKVLVILTVVILDSLGMTAIQVACAQSTWQRCYTTCSEFLGQQRCTTTCY